MSLELGFGGGDAPGPLLKTAKAPAFYQLKLFAEFRNVGSSPLAAVIDTLPMDHAQYRMETSGADGSPVRLFRAGGCGEGVPLHEGQIFSIPPGGAVRTPLLLVFHHLPPGSHRLRLTYEARQTGGTFGRITDPVALERLKQLWVGTTVSDWITVTMGPA